MRYQFICDMQNTTDWHEEAKLLLKAELARRGVTYVSLVEKLNEVGVEETAGAIANKISRGRFPMAFFLQCMHVIGATEVSVGLRKDSRN